ncbi:MAG: glutamate--tRNA ligase [Clostridia bacterium]|nr:glutamate--tRNA ligase [Clostridia bacterium]
MDNAKLAALLFPNVTKTPDDYEKMYPPRDLAEGVKVTRFAPSPTGFMHLGNLFSALIDKLAAGKDGVFYLRIEDTDKKREVDGAIDAALAGLAAFGVVPNEGMTGQESEKGAYGPYKQSKRADIYACYAKKLVEEGRAYPCFCTEEELADIRARQEAEGANPGYYGKWAVWRDKNEAEIEAALAAGKPYVLRLRSLGDENKKIFVDDLVKGRIEMPENTQDIVLLKTDGIPTYHFAHAVDDHLMRTTHVVRGDEWIASLPLHVELFRALGFRSPKYVHISPIMKLEDGNKRKLSKRKDPEAAVSYYIEKGYPAGGVVEYLMTLANSNFEDWRRANKDKPADDFPFNVKKMSPSGALFDEAKFEDICKNIISVMSAGEVAEKTAAWAEKYDPELYALIEEDPQKFKNILLIDRDVPKPRKDIAAWSMVKGYLSYFYDSLFRIEDAMPDGLSDEDINSVLDAYIAAYDENDDKDTWFQKIKDLCEPLGFTPNVKEYKQNSDAYKGHVGDVSGVIRVATTGRRNTPDLYYVLQYLGRERVIARLREAKRT